MAQTNKSLLISSDDLSNLMPQFAIYLIEGLLIFFTNTIIFICVWRFEFLRRHKEYIVMSGLALMDSLSGFAMASAGLGRLIQIFSKTANDLQTRFECLLTPWNMIWFPSAYTYGASLAMVSLDRLISWLVPNQYRKWGMSYALTLIATVHLPYWPLILYRVATSVYPDTEKSLPAICYTEWIHEIQYYHLLTRQRAFWAWTSVLLYIGVAYKYRQHSIRVEPVDESEKKHLEKQGELTKTIGLSCLITLLTEILPRLALSALTAFKGANRVSEMLIPLVGVISSLNKLSNPLLYVKRHDDIAIAVQSILTGTELSPQAIEEAAGMHTTAVQAGDGDIGLVAL